MKELGVCKYLNFKFFMSLFLPQTWLECSRTAQISESWLSVTKIKQVPMCQLCTCFEPSSLWTVSLYRSAKLKYHCATLLVLRVGVIFFCRLYLQPLIGRRWDCCCRLLPEPFPHNLVPFLQTMGTQLCPTLCYNTNYQPFCC